MQRLLLAALGLTTILALPATARADEDVLMPISLGAIGNRDFQASTVGFGMGPYDDKLSMLFYGRAMLGPDISAGMGGVNGGYAFVESDKVHFGVDMGVSVGAGRYRRRGTGVLAAAEPGLFLRLLSKKAGAVHMNLGWYQPVYIPRDGVAGSAMVSIGWSPFFKD